MMRKKRNYAGRLLFWMYCNKYIRNISLCDKQNTISLLYEWLYKVLRNRSIKEGSYRAYIEKKFIREDKQYHEHILNSFGEELNEEELRKYQLNVCPYILSQWYKKRFWGEDV